PARCRRRTPLTECPPGPPTRHQSAAGARRPATAESQRVGCREPPAISSKSGADSTLTIWSRTGSGLRSLLGCRASNRSSSLISMDAARVTDVEHLGGRVLRVVFADGLVRELDFEGALPGVLSA